MQYLNTLSFNTIKLEELVGFVTFIYWWIFVRRHLVCEEHSLWHGNSLSYQNVLLPQNDEDIGTRQRKLEKARNEYQLEQKYFSLTEDQQNQVNLVNVPPMVSS